MAVDLTSKRLNAATDFIDGTEMLMAGFEKMVNADVEATSAALVFADADFAGTSLKHVDAATLAAARTKLTAIKTWMTTNRDAFDKVRS